MELNCDVRLTGGVYHVEIGLGSVAPLSPVEQEALQRFGEPVVECGGTFGEGDSSFTLPAVQRRLPSQFPVKQMFSLADFEDANARAVLFRDTMITRLTAVRTALLARDPGYTGHSVIPIPQA